MTDIKAFLLFASLVAVLATVHRFCERRTDAKKPRHPETLARNRVFDLVSKKVGGLDDDEFNLAVHILVDKYHYGGRYGLRFADYQPEYLAERIKEIVWEMRDQQVQRICRKAQL